MDTVSAPESRKVVPLVNVIVARFEAAVMSRIAQTGKVLQPVTPPVLVLIVNRFNV